MHTTTSKRYPNIRPLHAPPGSAATQRDNGRVTKRTKLRHKAADRPEPSSPATEIAWPGYYSLTVGQIDTLEAPERVRRGMGQYPIPLIILARLAIDLDDQKRSLGFSLLQDTITRAIAVAKHADIRALLPHPLDAEAYAFYRRFGFEPAPHDQRQLLLLLKDARRVAGTAR